jgi:hypothetical protein
MIYSGCYKYVGVTATNGHTVATNAFPTTCMAKLGFRLKPVEDVGIEAEIRRLLFFGQSV